MQDENLSLVGKFFRNKWVWLVMAVDVLVTIVVIVLFVNKSARTAMISFNVAPVDAKISVDGSSNYTNSGEVYYLTPGVHSVQISHDDLDPKTYNVELKENYNTTIVSFLTKDDSFYFYTLRDNFSSFERLAEIASINNNQTIDKDNSAEGFISDFWENYGLYRTELPIEYRESDGYGTNLSILKNITIKAGYDCDITLCIKALMVGTDDKNFINSLLEERGFNVEDFEIEYKFY